MSDSKLLIIINKLKSIENRLSIIEQLVESQVKSTVVNLPSGGNDEVWVENKQIR